MSLIGFLTLIMNGGAVNAKECPFSVPIHFVLSYTAGGPMDRLVRTVAREVEKKTSCKAIVLNVTGGATFNGVRAVAHANPHVPTVGFFAFLPMHIPTLIGRANEHGIDIFKELNPIAMLGGDPFAFVVSGEHPGIKSAQVKTIDDYFAAVRRDRLLGAIGAPSFGSSQHLMTLDIRLSTELDLVWVDHKGQAGVVNALQGGHVPAGIVYYSEVLANKGKYDFRVLMVTGEKRWEEFPDAPRTSELGFLTLNAYNGVFVPEGMSKKDVEYLTSLISEIGRSDELREYYQKWMMIPTVLSGEDAKRLFLEFGRTIEAKGDILKLVKGCPAEYVRRKGTILDQLNMWVKAPKECK